MAPEDDQGPPEIIDNAKESRFEMWIGGHVAFLRYVRRRNRLALVHTEVPNALRGRGAGERLVRGVLD